MSVPKQGWTHPDPDPGISMGGEKRREPLFFFYRKLRRGRQRRRAGPCRRVGKGLPAVRRRSPLPSSGHAWTVLPVWACCSCRKFISHERPHLPLLTGRLRLLPDVQVSRMIGSARSKAAACISEEQMLKVGHELRLEAGEACPMPSPRWRN